MWFGFLNKHRCRQTEIKIFFGNWCSNNSHSSLRTVVGQEQKSQTYRPCFQRNLKVKGVCYLCIKREVKQTGHVNYLHQRNKAAFPSVNLLCLLFVLNLRIERVPCYSGSHPSLTSQLLQDALTTLDFLVSGSKIKCYGCTQSLSSQLQIDWSKTKFNLIFLWHGGWSLGLAIFCSKKTDLCCAFQIKFSLATCTPYDIHVPCLNEGSDSHLGKDYKNDMVMNITNENTLTEIFK